MKLAKVIPMFKNGDEDCVRHYRAVISFLREIVCEKSDLFIDKYKILYEYQYSFRRNRNITYAVWEMLEEITEVTESYRLVFILTYRKLCIQ